MIRTVLSLVITLFLVSGCTTNQKKKNERKVDVIAHISKAQKLKGTTWYYDIAKGNCADTIHFISADSLRTHLGEPMDDHLGNYFIKNDTVFVSIKGGLYDDEFPIGSRHRVKPYDFKLLFSDSNLMNLNKTRTYSKKIK